MAAESRRTDPLVEIDERFQEAFRFDFFQAVRLLHRALPDRKPVGYTANPRDEVVRFHSRIGLDFPACAVDEVTTVPDGANDSPRLHMRVNMMGLAGPTGALPRHYTELALHEQHRKATALRDFLDLFNHRLISLLYRAWEKHNLPAAYERSARTSDATADEPQQLDPVTRHLMQLIGFGSTLLRQRLKALAVRPTGLVHFAALMAQQPRSASALRSVLGEYFAVQVRVIQFTGRWLEVSLEDRTRIGTGGVNTSLGIDSFAGDRVWDQQARFRLRLGPMSFVRFCSFLPCGSAFRPLVMLTRLFVGQEHDFDVQLVLVAAEAPPCRLGDHGEASARLGWSSWLATKPFDSDVDTVVLSGAATMEGAFSM